MSDTKNSFKCKGNAAASVGDLFGGMVHGYLGLFGAGSLFDPLGKAKGKVSDALAKINSQTAADAPAFAKASVDVQAAALQLQYTQNLQLKKMFSEGESEIWDAVEEDNMFIAILGMLVFIMFFFMLIAPPRK